VLGDLAGLAPGRPGLRLDGDGTVTGVASAVPNGLQADRLLVAAAPAVPEVPGAAEPVAVLVDPHHPRVVALPCATASGLRVDELHLDRVPVEPGSATGAGAADLLATVRRHALVLSAAEAVGMVEEATRLTAAHLTDRHQFGRPLATFQAVAHRLADCHIDAQAMTVTLWQAAFEVAHGEDPVATAEAVEVARIWACQGLHRVLSAAQHLHGGIGADVDYPLHRYFLRGKQLELLLGDASAHLAELGDRLAEPVGGAGR